MKGKISAGFALLVLSLVASVAYFAPWRLPPAPPAVSHVKGPSWATVEQIHPARHSNEECFWPEVGFHILVGLDAVRTFKGPPVVSFRITEEGAADQVRIVRSSGSIKVDEDLAGQIARRHYAFPRGCGGLLVTVTPSIEFPDS